MLKNLIDIANDYVTQDNYGTRHPIMVTLTELVEVPNIHNEGEFIMWYRDGDHGELSSQKEVLNFILEELYEETKWVRLDKEQRENYRDIKDDLKYDSGVLVMKEYLEDNDFSFYTFDKKRKRTGENFFLTLSAAREHIERNGHHYDDPKPYIIYANRNPEMHTVINQLYELATVPKEEWNEEALHYYKYYILKEEER